MLERKMDVYHHRELSEEERRRRRGVAGGLVTARKEKMKNAGKVGVEGWRAEVGSRRRRRAGGGEEHEHEQWRGLGKYWK